MLHEEFQNDLFGLLVDDTDARHTTSTGSVAGIIQDPRSMTIAGIW